MLARRRSSFAQTSSSALILSSVVASPGREECCPRPQGIGGGQLWSSLRGQSWVMPELPGIRQGQFGVFTSAQAHECGWSRHQIQGGLRSGLIGALRRGVYVEKRSYDAASSAERSMACAVAACLARPGSVVSHHSAALIHDLPLLGSRPAIPTLTFPADCGRHGDSDRTVILRSSVLPSWQVQHHGGWRVATVTRTVCDLAREVSLLDALVLA